MGPHLGAERTAQSELEPGEKLLWAGQPDPKRLALQSLPVVLFGIPFTAFAVFWIVNALNIGSNMPRTGAFSFFPLFGIPFLLVGLGMLTSPWWAHRKGSQTVYAVTDRRLLIIKGGAARSVQSFDENSIGNIERVERSNGSGDIIFAQQVRDYGGGDGDARTSVVHIGFFGIPDVRSVEKLVRDVTQRSTRPTT
jgi:hypothetical protein